MDSCGRCLTTAADSASALWFTPTCGHALCDRCKREAFSRHRMSACGARGVDGGRACDATFSAADLSHESADDREFAAIIRARRSVRAVFNAVRADFPDDASWEAYSERAETLAFALASGVAAERADADAMLQAQRSASSRDIAAAAIRERESAAASARALADAENATEAARRKDAGVFAFEAALGAAARAIKLAAATSDNITLPGPGGGTVSVVEAHRRLVDIRAARVKKAASTRAAALARGDAWRPTAARIALGIHAPAALAAPNARWGAGPTQLIPRATLLAHFRAAGVTAAHARAAAAAELDEMVDCAKR